MSESHCVAGAIPTLLGASDPGRWELWPHLQLPGIFGAAWAVTVNYDILMEQTKVLLAKGPCVITFDLVFVVGAALTKCYRLGGL